MADTPLRHNAQVAGKLDRYRSMRDLDASPEPSGAADQDEASGSARFVIQEHHARRLHWDLRLERDGVLASWALPRGIPGHPKENRLAVRTEDHPLEYLTFHGEIPKGTYGAGTMEVWDSGTYLCEKFREDEVMVTLRGARVSGRYVLFRTRGKDWMIHRMDPPADPSAEPMPDAIAPMLARDGRLPRDDDAHGYEIKWDGVRAIARVDAGHLTLAGRNGSDFSGRYPEIRALADDQGSRRMVLDGEVVAFDPDGRPSFERLQSRMNLGSDSAVRRRLRDIPVTYVVFDVLWLQGHSTLALPYRDRRKLLLNLDLNGPTWRTPVHREGDGAALLEASEAQHLEGIVAKRLDSPYEPGRRSSAWIKIKNHCVQEFVVGGFTPGGGGRSTALGALAVGVYERAGESGGLLYAGKVGTGFTEATMGMLMRELEPLRSSDNPFSGRRPPKETIFVEPRLVARVEFREWTKAGTLRAPSFKGLVPDADPSSVIRET
jgi:bifunctional non-homologous end joining protein LigD